MSASPELYRPPVLQVQQGAFSPLAAAGKEQEDEECYYHDHDHRTPTGSAITYLRREPTTCPPAPRKKPCSPSSSSSCRKRLFQHAQGAGGGTEVPLISLRLEELERIFRPVQVQVQVECRDNDKRRRSSSGSLFKRRQQQVQVHLTTEDGTASIHQLD